MTTRPRCARGGCPGLRSLVNGHVNHPRPYCMGGPYTAHTSEIYLISPPHENVAVYVYTGPFTLLGKPLGFTPNQPKPRRRWDARPSARPLPGHR